MSTTKPIKVHVAEVTRHDGPISLPKTMTVAKAIEVLQQREKYDESNVNIVENVPVFPWDGALALSQALTEQFGFALQQSDWGFFGEIPPTQIEVQTGLNTTIKVPWGSFTLPGVKGKVATGVHNDNGRIIFRMIASVTHSTEEAVHKLFARTRELALANSIYRGKSFSIKFKNDDDEWLNMAQIEFLNLPDTPCIFNRDLETAIATNLLTTIRYTDAVKAAGIPIKRGVLLAGQYGTGKTLTAAWIARECAANRWTFIYVKSIDELPHAINFATLYQPALIFGEDVDRTAGSTRTDEVNTLLNTLDGIGNKAMDVMVVLTTNHPDQINEAMRRPGRIDAIIKVDPPDHDAVVRLMILFGEASISANAVLDRAADLLAGQKPAVIREVVERAKLSALERTDGMSNLIIGADLEASAQMLLAEQSLFRSPVVTDDPLGGFSVAVANRMTGQLAASIEKSLQKVIDNNR